MKDSNLSIKNAGILILIYLGCLYCDLSEAGLLCCKLGKHKHRTEQPDTTETPLYRKAHVRSSIHSGLRRSCLLSHGNNATEATPRPGPIYVPPPKVPQEKISNTPTSETASTGTSSSSSPKRHNPPMISEFTGLHWWVAPAVDPVDPVAPAADPIDPVTPVADPVDPVTPVADPVDSVTPVVDPVDLVAPVVDPVDPVTPVADPVDSVAPVVEPVDAPADLDRQSPLLSTNPPNSSSEAIDFDSSEHFDLPPPMPLIKISLTETSEDKQPIYIIEENSSQTFTIFVKFIEQRLRTCTSGSTAETAFLSRVQNILKNPENLTAVIRDAYFISKEMEVERTNQTTKKIVVEKINTSSPEKIVTHKITATHWLKTLTETIEKHTSDIPETLTDSSKYYVTSHQPSNNQKLSFTYNETLYIIPSAIRMNLFSHFISFMTEYIEHECCDFLLWLTLLAFLT